jgi:hypothetical protein
MAKWFILRAFGSVWTCKDLWEFVAADAFLGGGSRCELVCEPFSPRLWLQNGRDFDPPTAELSQSPDPVLG